MNRRSTIQRTLMMISALMTILVLFSSASYAIQAPKIYISPTILVTASPQSAGVNQPVNIVVDPYLVDHWKSDGFIQHDMTIDLQYSGPGTAILGKTSGMIADGFNDTFLTTFKAQKAGEYTVTVMVTYTEYIFPNDFVTRTVTNSTKITVTSGNIGFNPGAGFNPGFSGIVSPSPTPSIGIHSGVDLNLSGFAGLPGNGTSNQTAQPSNDTSGQVTPQAQPSPGSSSNTQDNPQTIPAASQGTSSSPSSSATSQQGGNGDSGSMTTYLIIAVVALIAIVGILGGYILGKGKK